MAEEDDNDLIEIEDDEEEGEKDVYIKYNYNNNFCIILFIQEGMNIDLNKAMQECQGIEQVQERTNTGVVSLNVYYNHSTHLFLQRQKFDSATSEKNKQEQGKK